jgi:hypothetical protein
MRSFPIDCCSFAVARSADQFIYGYIYIHTHTLVVTGLTGCLPQSARQLCLQQDFMSMWKWKGLIRPKGKVNGPLGVCSFPAQVRKTSHTFKLTPCSKATEQNTILFTKACENICDASNVNAHMSNSCDTDGSNYHLVKVSNSTNGAFW